MLNQLLAVGLTVLTTCYSALTIPNSKMDENRVIGSSTEANQTISPRSSTHVESTIVGSKYYSQAFIGYSNLTPSWTRASS